MFSSFQNLVEERNTGLHWAGVKLFRHTGCRGSRNLLSVMALVFNTADCAIKMFKGGRSQTESLL